jgi:MFS family permease
MAPSGRWLIPLCLAAFLWAVGFGASAPLASLWLQDAGAADTLIGLNTGAYYLGIVLAAGLVPRLLGRHGHWCLLAGMLVSGLSMAVFPWANWLPGLFFLRILNGVAAALSLVPLETFVNRQSAPQRRAQNFGYYAFSIALGMALGTFLGMGIYPAMPRMAFVLSGVIPVIGFAVILAWRPVFTATAPEHRRRARFSILRNFLSFGSTWSQGFLEGGMIGLLPLYLLSVGLSDSGASYLMAGLMVGVIIAQLPLASTFWRLATSSRCWAWLA